MLKPFPNAESPIVNDAEDFTQGVYSYTSSVRVAFFSQQHCYIRNVCCRNYLWWSLFPLSIASVPSSCPRYMMSRILYEHRQLQKLWLYLVRRTSMVLLLYLYYYCWLKRHQQSTATTVVLIILSVEASDSVLGWVSAAHSYTSARVAFCSQQYYYLRHACCRMHSWWSSLSSSACSLFMSAVHDVEDYTSLHRQLRNNYRYYGMIRSYIW